MRGNDGSREPVPIHDVVDAVLGNDLIYFSNAVKQSAEKMGGLRSLAQKSGVSLSTLRRIVGCKVRMGETTYHRLWSYMCPYLPNDQRLFLHGRDKWGSTSKRTIEFPADK